MLNMEMLEDIVYGALKEARIRYGDAWIDRIKVASRKIYVYMNVSGEKVKVIIYRDQIRVRVYSRLKGLSIALQRIYEREYHKAYKRWERERKKSL